MLVRGVSASNARTKPALAIGPGAILPEQAGLKVGLVDCCITACSVAIVMQGAAQPALKFVASVFKNTK